eukprot:Pgem_evm1s6301
MDCKVKEFSDKGFCLDATSVATCDGENQVTCSACADTHRDVGGGVCESLCAQTCHNSASCTNTQGSDYECVCNNGYAGDGIISCDINECTADIDNCHTQATCVDIQPGFLCDCNNGYVGDGVATCVGCNKEGFVITNNKHVMIDNNVVAQCDSIDLSGNEIRSMEMGIFDTFSVLQSLNLNNNNITRVEFGFFDELINTNNL